MSSPSETIGTARPGSDKDTEEQGRSSRPRSSAVDSGEPVADLPPFVDFMEPEDLAPPAPKAAEPDPPPHSALAPPTIVSEPPAPEAAEPDPPHHSALAP